MQFFLWLNQIRHSYDGVSFFGQYYSKPVSGDKFLNFIAELSKKLKTDVISDANLDVSFSCYRCIVQCCIRIRSKTKTDKMCYVRFNRISCT